VSHFAVSLVTPGVGFFGMEGSACSAPQWAWDVFQGLDGGKMSSRMIPVGATVRRRPRHLVGLYSRYKTANVSSQPTRTRWHGFLGFHSPSHGTNDRSMCRVTASSLRDQAAVACLFGDRFVRRSTLWARLCSPPGLAMTSINSFWAST